jgi:hypothetical protein
MTAKSKKSLIGIIGQWSACLSATIGIIIELVTHADTGYICISAAGFLLAIFTKIKCEGMKK